MADMQALPREVNQFGPSPTIAQLVGDPEVVKEIEDFSTHLVNYCETLRQRCERGRSEAGLESRMARNDARARQEVRIAFDREGAIIKEQSPDAHCFMGLTQGWTSEANEMVGAYLYSELFTRAKRPYVCKARGTRSENRLAEKVCYDVIDDLLRLGDLKGQGHDLTREIPRHGTSVLRYELGVRKTYQRNAEGVFEEGLPVPVPVFTIWPLSDMLVTHLHRSEMKEQEGVFWITPRVTLADLEQQEMQYITLEGQAMPVGGKFRNLDVLRGKHVREDSPTDSDLDGKVSVSVHDQGMLVEFEGALPIAQWVRDGRLWWDVAGFFGVDVGQMPNPNDPEEMEEWARRLSRITHWKVSYFVQGSASRAARDNGVGTLLQFEPDRHKEPRNSGTVVGYIKDGRKFYRRSTADLGRHIEDAADRLFNTAMYVDDFNGRPPMVYDPRLAASNRVEDLETLIRDRKPIAGAPNMRIEECIQFFKLPVDPLAFQKIEQLKQRHENITGVTAALKGSGNGAPSSGTLGELQLTESKSALRLNDVILAAARALAEVIGRVLADSVQFFGEGWAEYAARVSGKPKSEIERILPSLDGLEHEIEITHPLFSREDPAVLATLIMKVAQLFPDAFPDTQRLALAILEIAGYSRGEDLMEDNRTMDPEDEQNQFAGGNWVEPTMQEDVAFHLATHMAIIEQIEAQGGPQSPQEANMAQMVMAHVKATMDMVQRFQRMQALMNPQPLNPDGTPAEGVPGTTPGSTQAPGQGPQPQGPMGAGAPQPAAKRGGSAATDSVPAKATGVKNSLRSQAKATPAVPGGGSAT